MVAQGGVETHGLREFIKKLEKFGVEVSDMKKAFKTIGNVVVDEAKTLSPKLSGRLSGSIVASNTKNKSVVRAGGARIPYAGVIHYGWPAHGIEAHPFLTGALHNKSTEVYSTFVKEIQGLIRSENLD